MIHMRLASGGRVGGCENLHHYHFDSSYRKLTGCRIQECRGPVSRKNRDCREEVDAVDFSCPGSAWAREAQGRPHHHNNSVIPRAAKLVPWHGSPEPWFMRGG